MIGLGTTDPFTTFVASLAFWVGAMTSHQRVGRITVGSD